MRSMRSMRGSGPGMRGMRSMCGMIGVGPGMRRMTWSGLGMRGMRSMWGGGALAYFLNSWFEHPSLRGNLFLHFFYSHYSLIFSQFTDAFLLN